MIKSILKKRKKGLWLVLIGSLLVFSNFSLAMENKHGDVLLMKTQDGQEIKGELLAVKGTKLVLLDLDASSGIEIEIDTIRHIRIVKRDKTLQGMWTGLLIGAGSGALLGLLSGKNDSGWFSFSAGQKALMGAIRWGLPMGGIWGAIKGNDGFVTLEGRSPEEIKIALDTLNQRARFPGYIPKVPETVYTAGSTKEKKHREKYNAVLKRIQERDSSRDPSTQRYKRFHFSCSLEYFPSRTTDNLAELFNNIGFGDIKPGGSFFGFEYGPTLYPQVESTPIFDIKNINLEFSISKKFAVGLGYSAIRDCGITGYKMILLDSTSIWGKQYYSEQNLKGNFSGNIYYLTGAWKPIPDGIIKRLSAEVGIGIGISLFNLSYKTSGYKTSDFKVDKDVEFTSKRLNPVYVVFAEYDYFIGRSWSIGLKIEYKRADIQIDSINLQGYYLDMGSDDSLITNLAPVNIPSHIIKAGGLGIGITLGLHF